MILSCGETPPFLLVTASDPLSGRERDPVGDWPPAPSGDLTQGHCWEVSFSDRLGTPHSQGFVEASSRRPLPTQSPSRAPPPGGWLWAEPSRQHRGPGPPGEDGQRVRAHGGPSAKSEPRGVSEPGSGTLAGGFSAPPAVLLSLPGTSGASCSGCCLLTAVALAVGVLGFPEGSPGRKPTSQPRHPLLSEAQQIRSLAALTDFSNAATLLLRVLTERGLCMSCQEVTVLRVWGPCTVTEDPGLPRASSVPQSFCGDPAPGGRVGRTPPGPGVPRRQQGLGPTALHVVLHP